MDKASEVGLDYNQLIVHVNKPLQQKLGSRISPLTMTSNEKEELIPDHGRTFAHRLESHNEGDSSVEQQARKIEIRRKNRTPVTFVVRVKLLQECRNIAKEKGYENTKRISRQDLVDLRDKYARAVAEQKGKAWIPWIPIAFGIKTFELNMLEILERAVIHTTILNDWFYFVDYAFYHTVVVHRFPWMRNESANAFVVVALFYICTPIFFCYILGDTNICEASSEISWLNGCYMASVTLVSTSKGSSILHFRSLSNHFLCRVQLATVI